MGYKTFLCPLCGDDEVYQVYVEYTTLYKLQYDEEGKNIIETEYETESSGEYEYVCTCGNEVIATIEVDKREDYEKLKELWGNDRIMYVLKLIGEGKARVYRDVHIYGIDDDVDLLKYIIEKHKDYKVREYAKKILIKIVPRAVIERI